eukprot:1841871-Rhodomonas_salina.2
MLYNRDGAALRKVIRCFLQELQNDFDCTNLQQLNESLPLVGIRALFLFLVIVDTRLRYWAMLYESRSIVKPPPAKVALFLRTLQDELVPAWMSDERKNASAFVRAATELYIKC